MDWIFVEVFMARAAAIDVFPCGFVVESQFIWRDSNHRPILVVGCFDVERDPASKEAYSQGYLSISANLVILYVVKTWRMKLTGDTRANTGPGNLARGWK